MIELRPYQQAAVDAIFGYWSRGGGNPLVDLATGLGKSVIIAKLTQDVLREYRDMRVLILVHVRELVEQDFKAMIRLWPGAPVGINSAGLGRRDRHSQILFASIQSVFRDAEAIGQRRPGADRRGAPRAEGRGGDVPPPPGAAARPCAGPPRRRLHRHAIPARQRPAGRRRAGRPPVRRGGLFLRHRRRHRRRLVVAVDLQGERDRDRRVGR
jgi:hypothetical protein